MRKEVLQNIPKETVGEIAGGFANDGAEKIECFQQNDGLWVIVAWFN